MRRRRGDPHPAPASHGCPALAGSAAVLEDGSGLSRIDRALHRAERVMALLAGLAVLALILLAVVSVGGRNVMGSGVPGYVDWIEQAMPPIAFLGIAYCARLGGHIRMDVVVGQLRGRALWAAEAATTAATLLLVLLLIWGAWDHFLRSFDMGAPMWSRDSTMDIGLPIWPAKLVVPFTLAVLAARLGLQLWGYARGLRRGGTPVGVPLVQSAAEVAAAEAETVAGRG